MKKIENFSEKVSFDYAGHRSEKVEGEYKFINLIGEKLLNENSKFKRICNGKRLAEFRDYWHTNDYDYEIMCKYQNMCVQAMRLANEYAEYEMNNNQNNGSKNIAYEFLLDEEEGILCVISLNVDDDYDYQVNHFGSWYTEEPVKKLETFNALETYKYYLNNKEIQINKMNTITRFANIKVSANMLYEYDYRSHSNFVFINFYRLIDLYDLIDLSERIKFGCNI